MLQRIPLFKLSFSEKDLMNVSTVLEYSQIIGGYTFLSRGARAANIICVERGKLKIIDAKNEEQIVHVGTKCGEIPAEEVWQPVFVIGVKSMLYDNISAITIESTRDTSTVVWNMDMHKADSMLSGGTALQYVGRGMEIMALVKMPMFRKIKNTDPRLLKLLSDSNKMELWRSELVFEQGDDGDSLYILIDGCVSIEVNGNVVANQSADADQGRVQYFGDMAILEGSGAKRTASVRVSSQVAAVVNVPLAVVNECFGSVVSLLKEQGTDAQMLLQESHQRNNANQKQMLKQQRKQQMNRKT
jgi:CRP-like cAMP-binding protein